MTSWGMYPASRPARCLVAAWFLYHFRNGGIWVMLARDWIACQINESDIYSTNIRIPSFVQVITFGMGLLATIVFGIAVTK